ncbi:MAG: polynucleotide adenylyltransferase PcnB [Candidatus Binataceae bacterium]
MEPSILERAQHPVSRRDIDPDVLKVLYRLINAGYSAYLVGGGVRDLMTGRRPKDFDVATSAHPSQVRELFRNSRLIGRRFRLVHVFFGPRNIEVATFRRHSEETPESDDPLIRHDNTFGTPEEDAFRRDFTVNALFYDPRTFHVIDYVGGVDDLRGRLIRSVGEPEIRMREDPVRMIRAVRFAAKLDFEIEPATRAAIEQHCGDLAKASAPRLVEEIYRTLGFRNAARALTLMTELGLLGVLLPGLWHHLRDYGDDWATSPTVRNLEALGRAANLGMEPSHPSILASLFADLHLVNARRSSPSDRLSIVNDLRLRGFSRADTEHMRLLLESLPHLLTPSRLTRKLARRPYFAQAHRLFELIAPTYGADPQALDRFLSEPARPHPGARHGGAHAQAHGPGGEGGPPFRQRRRRRGGRRRRRHEGASATKPTPANHAHAGAAIDGGPGRDGCGGDGEGAGGT